MEKIQHTFKLAVMTAVAITLAVLITSCGTAKYNTGITNGCMRNSGLIGYK